MGWLNILPALGGWISEFIQGRQKITAANAEAKAEHQTARINAMAGLTDEIAYIVMAYPFVSLFIPPLAPYTITGFNYLNTLPDWYVGVLVTMSLAAVGMPNYIRVRGVKNG